MAVEVKICGLTRPEDAALAVAHGAWRLGVIFAGGPRQVDVIRAREIVAAASGVPVLGVFGTVQPEAIREMVEAAGLSGAQLHDNSELAAVEWLRAWGYEVWRVATIDARSALVEELALRGAGADALLVEPRHDDGRGGKGIALPEALAIAARRAAPPVKFVLAGGLRPENVGRMIRLVGPDAVDVSSGVESAPGLKDSDRLLRFLEIVRDARSAA